MSGENAHRRTNKKKYVIAGNQVIAAKVYNLLVAIFAFRATMTTDQIKYQEIVAEINQRNETKRNGCGAERKKNEKENVCVRWTSESEPNNSKVNIDFSCWWIWLCVDNLCNWLAKSFARLFVVQLYEFFVAHFRKLNNK